MNIRLIPLAAAALLILGGCDKTPTERSQDVADVRENAMQESGEARQDASKTVAKAQNKVVDAQQAYNKSDEGAQKKLSAAESSAMIKTAEANFEVAKTEAQGRNDVAAEKCAALDGVDEDACLSTAKADLAASEAAATATRDAALVHAEHHE